MSETIHNSQAPDGIRSGETLTSPAGLQSMAELRRRRFVMLALNCVTYALLMAVAARVASAGGWSTVDAISFVCFALGTPWAVVGFWNAIAGLYLLHFHDDALSAVAPFIRAGDEETPLRVQTAVLMTLRNEAPQRAFARLQTLKASVDKTGEGGSFSYFILSDTNDADIAARESELVERWQAESGPGVKIVYRRREQNTGFKAGNVRDFCERWGRDYELMLPLDADSLMSGPAIVRLVRMMQAHVKIGILQSLVVGMPAQSPFARVFQFGMRLGMRTYTMGQAWWTGDCGPFWGHNALVRIKPFVESCALPMLPGTGPLSGHVLSHDQVEAVLMRRAGFEVRVMPFEDGSWEENPPTMVEFAQRDMRWCQGNMQYVKLLDLPGLQPMSRFQLIWAILMFVGIPAWTLLIALLPISAWQARAVADYPAGLAAALYLTFLIMYLAPKIAGFFDTILSKGGMASFGGPVRFMVSAIVELVFSFLQGAVSTIRTTLFMIGLVFGKSVHWGGQSRDNLGVSWADAVHRLWPQTLFGLVVCGALYFISPETLIWSLPLTAGYLLAVPFAVLTASPALGRLMQRSGLCAVPEDSDTPSEVADVLRRGEA